MGSKKRIMPSEEWSHYANCIKVMFSFLRELGYEGPSEKDHLSKAVGPFKTIVYSAPRVRRELSFSLIQRTRNGKLLAGLSIFRTPFSDWLNDEIPVEEYVAQSASLKSKRGMPLELPYEQALEGYGDLLKGELLNVIKGDSWLEGYGNWGPWE